MRPIHRHTLDPLPWQWRFWLSGLSGLLLLCLPVEAAELQDWRFDQNQNQLQFTTDQAVSPRVQLITDPMRLVVDLPGIIYDQPTIKQQVGTQVQGIRVGQLDPQTTRIVVELAPGYVFDPQRVKVTGATPRQWSIQLPPPQLASNSTTVINPPVASNPPPSPLPSPIASSPPRSTLTPSTPPPSTPPRSTPPTETPPTETPTSPPSLTAAATAVTISNIFATPSGFYIETQGGRPSFRVDRDRKQLTSTLVVRNATLGPRITRTNFISRYHGVESVAIQPDQDTGVVRIVLKSTEKKQRWQISDSKFGGIVLIPKFKISGSQQPTSAVSLIPQDGNTQPSTSNIATIKGVDLGGGQLLIRSDRPLQYNNRWQGATYQITIPSARLAPGLRPPRIGLGSSLSSVQVQQQDPSTVVIRASLARGVRVSKLERLSDGNLLLSLLRPGAPAPRSIPSNPSFPRTRVSGTPLPKPTGRRIVVIDPGHGGKDPGAIGIGGLRETDVVLDISRQVASLLQQQGVIVRMTRSSENFVSLQGRVTYAERVNADIFVSIHANAISLSRPDVNGLETFYAPGARQGAVLARTIQNTILRSINMGSRGVRAARFYVIRKSSMPAALVETGFVTGREDAPRLNNPAWRAQMSEAIARGILNYLSGQYN